MLGERLGIGIANAINTFDPLEVVIGGGVSRAGDAAARARARARPSATWCRALGAKTTIRIARHGPRAGVLGAALLAAQEYGGGPAAGPAGRGGGGDVKIACAFDHAGFPLKSMVLETRRRARATRRSTSARGRPTPSTTPTPPATAAEAVRVGDADRAVLVCGSGAGVAVAACKFPGIRAAVAHDTYTAHQCVEHDDVNVRLPRRRASSARRWPRTSSAPTCAAEFTGEERHKRRLAKIDGIEREFLRDD